MQKIRYNEYTLVFVCMCVGGGEGEGGCTGDKL